MLRPLATAEVQRPMEHVQALMGYTGHTSFIYVFSPVMYMYIYTHIYTHILYIYGVIWDYMGLYGTIWDYMGLYGIIWDDSMINID